MTTYQATFKSSGTTYHYYDINAWAQAQHFDISQLPYSLRVLLEMTLRQQKTDPAPFLSWPAATQDIAFKPERVILQDFTGVPALVDLAAMRSQLVTDGGDPDAINPDVPVDLIIDHSVQVDRAGDGAAFKTNIEKEFARNHERYQFLKWAQQAFKNLRIVPPDTGIIHQINLEYLASVVRTTKENGAHLAFPDTVVGTDSHTTMVNSLGVLGWGVGGIEAEASMLGEPSYMQIPQVVGVRLTHQLPKGATATDLALTVTKLLRAHNVVGKFVEFYGPGLAALSVADRATIANMAPEYGATASFFPIDQQTLNYLKLTNRSAAQIQLISDYAQQNHLFHDGSEQCHYSETENLDLTTIVPSLAGPSRPQDLVPLTNLKQQFTDSETLAVTIDGQQFNLQRGDLAIAAITSCTNTSNPSLLLTAGLIAQKAVAAGLHVPAYVKTSFAPGSKVVTAYLAAAGLQSALDQLGFNLVGYGCTTCIGNSGQLKPEMQQAVAAADFPIAAIESGNRNFAGRVNPLVKDTYLASPPLIVAYALAGTLKINLATEPLGYDHAGEPVFLKDLWPAASAVSALIQQTVTADTFKREYASLLTANETWNALPAPTGSSYAWQADSTYIALPPFFEKLTHHTGLPTFTKLRALAKFGDSITTDHISPAGFIGQNTPAGQYLRSKNIAPLDFNSYGSRRGNHNVMMRGTLANIRIQNQLTPEKEGGYTRYWPTDEVLPIYDAATKYQADGTGLVILAGKDYGMGSSRDWAAKGVKLLGVKVVIAESFERIHRANLVMMGVLPLQFQAGENATSLGLTGAETFAISFTDHTANIVATATTGEQTKFTAKLRFDTPTDMTYYENDGILPLVLRRKANLA
ncbi:aconitate hydratase AcnA [Loigolactobacillus jiayinensis]|uniref:Aconitate hydratase n=1 Tax=Loigolactobacillus jiayinensis TaxID=2486016 RepID=A0ABW1RJA3_9LACO|nr:aconitate hydratase AcnA [Loigolactobacillus jiayinensis]